MADESSAGEESLQPTTLLFPVFNQKPTTPSDSINLLELSKSNAPGWLGNTSFTADLSAISTFVSSCHDHYSEPEEEEVEEAAAEQEERRPDAPSYDLVDSSASDQDHDLDKSGRSSNKKEKRKRRKRKKGAQSDYEYGPSSRKQDIQSWANSASSSSANKEYYFDSRGDRDNLAFCSLYR